MERLFWLGVGLAAGAGLFLATINRILSHLRIPPVKTIIALGCLVVLVGGFRLARLSGWGLAGPGPPGAGWDWAGRGELPVRCAAHAGTPAVERSGALLVLSRPVTTTDLVVERYEVRLGNVALSNPRADMRLRIAHLSDLHLNEHLPPDYYRRVFAAAVQAQPDIVFITGDFVSDVQGVHQYPDLAAGLHPRLGVYGIFGNHDYWAGADETARVLRAAGVELLGNTTRRLEADGRRLLLVGCEEPWGQTRLVDPQPQAGETMLVLSHTADHIYRFSRLGAAAVFTGHYHAGQFQIPWFGPVFVPSIYGRRFHHGHYRVGGRTCSSAPGSAQTSRRCACIVPRMSTLSICASMAVN